METEDFAANRTMRKDLQSFDCKPLGLTHQLKQWDELVNWLSFCMAVFGLLGFWAQTLKEFNVLQLKKDSMQGQFVST